MVKIKINKLDAARRQLDVAIRMTFSGEDPVAIHATAAGAHRIIRDICKKRGDIESYLRFTDWIAEGHEKEFWRHFNASANFIKHADDDVNEIHDMDDELSDFLIAFASKWYRDLGNTLSLEMRVFVGWWAIQNEKFMKHNAVLSVTSEYGILKEVEALSREMKKLPRKKRLEFGLLSLQKAKRQS
jgi:hypothetical protein